MMITKLLSLLIYKVKSIIIIIKSTTRGSYLSMFGKITSPISSFNIGNNVRVKNGYVLNAGKGKIILGNNVWINKHCEINANNLIDIGERTTIQKNVTINGDVSIGTDVIIAPNVFLSSGSHLYSHQPHLPIRVQEKICSVLPNKPILIEDDVWLGINVVVMPGVKIAKGCVIGANSVVTKDTTAYSVYAGMPAKLISNRFQLSSKSVYDFYDPETLPHIKSKINYDVNSLVSGELSFKLKSEVFQFEVISSFSKVELEIELLSNTASNIISLYGLEKKLEPGRNIIIWDDIPNYLVSELLTFRFSEEILTKIKLVQLKIED
ncbi:acyltransferase [Kangiella marina]|uniref:Acetyltransferase n=1 Tax=Kangiella marina TaxID=1079178 RepID=A0ABP8INU4_9GAMM